MWIKANERIDTPQGRLLRGDIGEVYDALGVFMKLKGRAVEVPEPADVEERFQVRLQNGAGKPCLFMPFVGEFGHQIMYHIRLVQFHQASEKIVCCRRGFEVLYPSATAFDYDWEDPIDDAVRAGTDRQLRDWPEIERRYPGYRPVQGGNTMLSQETLVLNPGGEIPLKPKTRGLKVDVCIGTRKRGMAVEKNWEHWAAVGRALQAAGLSVAVIGTREMSYPIEGAELSGDYGDVDAAVELLQNCKLFIGPDSGSAHLATLAPAPHVMVLPHPYSTRYLPRMAAVHPSVSFFPDACWTHPDKAVELAVQEAVKRCKPAN